MWCRLHRTTVRATFPSCTDTASASFSFCQMRLGSPSLLSRQHDIYIVFFPYIKCTRCRSAERQSRKCCKTPMHAGRRWWYRHTTRTYRNRPRAAQPHKQPHLRFGHKPPASVWTIRAPGKARIDHSKVLVLNRSGTVVCQVIVQ